jgi:hypothetical protein
MPRTFVRVARHTSKWIASECLGRSYQARDSKLKREVAQSYCSLAYSALACRYIGMSGSASFQSVRKSR